MNSLSIHLREKISSKRLTKVGIVVELASMYSIGYFSHARGNLVQLVSSKKCALRLQLVFSWS